VEITQSHRLAEGKSKVHKQQGVQEKGEYHLAEGKSKEKSLRIPPASEPVLYTSLTAARAIAWYSPVILVLTPLYLDTVYSNLLHFRSSSNFGIAEEVRRWRRVRNQQNLRNRNRSLEQNWKQRGGCPLTVRLMGGMELVISANTHSRMQGCVVDSSLLIKLMKI
jgi:hypothetical protein